MNRSIRIGLAGCGDIVKRYYLPALKRLQEEGKVKLAACCDLDSAKARETAAAGFQAVYTDTLEMMEREKPDGQIMAVPVERTALLAMEAAPMGIPIMLEKPPALTKEEAEKLAEAFRKYNVLHQVAFNRHFIPVAQDLKEKLKKETVRNLAVQMCRIGRVEPTFYTTAIHGIDLLRYLADGDYEKVSFTYQDLPEYGPHVSNFYLDCRFENGIRGQIAILVDSGIVNERVFASCKGTAYYARLPVWECSDSPGGVTVYKQDCIIASLKGPAVGSPLENAVASGFYGEILHFLQAVESGKQPAESMNYALPLVEIAQKLHNREREYKKC